MHIHNYTVFLLTYLYFCIEYFLLSIFVIYLFPFSPYIYFSFVSYWFISFLSSFRVVLFPYFFPVVRREWSSLTSHLSLFSFFTLSFVFFHTLSMRRYYFCVFQNASMEGRKWGKEEEERNGEERRTEWVMLFVIVHTSLLMIIIIAIIIIIITIIITMIIIMIGREVLSAREVEKQNKKNAKKWEKNL